MTYDDPNPRERKRGGGRRPAVTYHAICWRTMADFDQPHGRKNAHGEAMVTPGFDSLGELNDWLSDDTEWLYEEVTRYRRAAWAGSQPKDEIINERGVVLADVEADAVPMPEYVRDQLNDLFDHLTNEDRFGNRAQRRARKQPSGDFDATVRPMGYDLVYDAHGNLWPWIVRDGSGRPDTTGAYTYEEGVAYDRFGFPVDQYGRRLGGQS